MSDSTPSTPSTAAPSSFPFDAPAPGESSKHYAWFAAFRDVGPTRTLTGDETRTVIAPLNGGKLPDGRNLRRVASKWGWRERAARYDAYAEASKKAINVEVTTLAEVEDYRLRQLRLGKAMLEATIRLVTLANERMATLKPSELRAQDVPRFYEVAVKVAAGAASAEAQAIGLAELVRVLEEQEANSGWGTPAGARAGAAPRAQA